MRECNRPIKILSIYLENVHRILRMTKMTTSFWVTLLPNMSLKKMVLLKKQEKKVKLFTFKDMKVVHWSARKNFSEVNDSPSDSPYK